MTNSFISPRLGGNYILAVPHIKVAGGKGNHAF